MDYLMLKRVYLYNCENLIVAYWQFDWKHWIVNNKLLNLR